MKSKIKWGILGTATIAKEQLIPAIKQSKNSELIAIASRNIEKAKEIVNNYKIPKYFGSYDELLSDPQIDAVYIPLPNHLHLEYTLKALQNGKHVLVEKPICLKSEDFKIIIEEKKKYPGLKIMEAFMYKLHPQWKKVKELIEKGEIGELKLIQSSFSFYDDNAESIVNTKEYGGGSLFDIGCYPVSISRLLFNEEPKSLFAEMEIDSKLGIDTTTTCTLEFKEGKSQFFSSIRIYENQNVKIFGTKGILELPIPFNPKNDKESEIYVYKNNVKEIIKIEKCNQYEIEVSSFSNSILENKDPIISLDDSFNNMIIIDKIFESAKLGKRVCI